MLLGEAIVFYRYTWLFTQLRKYYGFMMLIRL